MVEGKCSASDHTARHRAENPAPASTALIVLGKDRLPGWQLGKNKEKPGQNSIQNTLATPVFQSSSLMLYTRSCLHEV